MVEFKVGQVWLTRDNSEGVEIKSISGNPSITYQVEGSNGISYNRKGKFFDTKSDGRDLVRLIQNEDGCKVEIEKTEDKQIKKPTPKKRCKINGHNDAVDALRCASVENSHYKSGKVEPIHLINSQNLNFNMGCIIKYACRKKGQDLEDLKKIKDYAEYEIERLSNV